MSATLYPAVAAVIFGTLLALMLVAPFAAIQYRRRGGLTVGYVILNFLVLLYLIALATYTLLPLPARVDNFCDVHNVQPQWLPFQFVTDIIREAALRGGGIGAYLRNPALLQIVFNVALFVPLGMIARYFLKVPVLVAALVGFGTSLLIEVTQVTGDWFLYPCAYRLFDVDDLLANTTGALIGAFLSPLLRIMPGQQAMKLGDPRPVTVLRRLVGMLCDWSIITFGAVAIVFVYLVALPDRSMLDPQLDTFLRLAAAPLLIGAVQLVWVLVTGRSIGETIVRVEPRPPTRFFARLLHAALGVAGFAVLSVIPSPIVGIIVMAAVLTSVIFVFSTRQHRGLSYLLNGWDIQDDRVEN